jgi:hypothetical protein
MAIHQRLKPRTATLAHPQHELEPRAIIPFTRHQLDSALSPHDVDSYARLKEYTWGKVRPLID